MATASVRAPETKKPQNFAVLRLVVLVRLAGIEPTTPWFVAKYSIQLSYSRQDNDCISISGLSAKIATIANSGPVAHRAGLYWPVADAGPALHLRGRQTQRAARRSGGNDKT